MKLADLLEVKRDKKTDLEKEVDRLFDSAGKTSLRDLEDKIIAADTGEEHHWDVYDAVIKKMLGIEEEVRKLERKHDDLEINVHKENARDAGYDDEMLGFWPEVLASVKFWLDGQGR